VRLAEESLADFCLELVRAWVESFGWGFAPSFSAHVRFGEHGAPVLFPIRWGLLRGKNVESCGLPHLAKNERDMGHPGFLEGMEFGVRWKDGH
jgi:hypothetical protein